MRRRRFIPFGDFAPDAPDRDNNALDEANNLLPLFGNYRPVPPLEEVTTLVYLSGGTPINSAYAHLVTQGAAKQHARPVLNEAIVGAGKGTLVLRGKRVSIGPSIFDGLMIHLEAEDVYSDGGDLKWPCKVSTVELESTFSDTGSMFWNETDSGINNQPSLETVDTGGYMGHTDSGVDLGNNDEYTLVTLIAIANPGFQDVALAMLASQDPPSENSALGIWYSTGGNVNLAPVGQSTGGGQWGNVWMLRTIRLQYTPSKTWDYWVNDSVNNSGTHTLSSGWMNGGDNHFVFGYAHKLQDGKVAAVLVWPFALTDSQIGDVHDELLTKYAWYTP